MTVWLFFIWAALAPPTFERLELYTTERECSRERARVIQLYRYAVTDCVKLEVTWAPYTMQPFKYERRPP